MISFTGSTATGGSSRAAAEHVTKVFLELGGKSAMILLDDLDDVSGPAMTAAFGTALSAGRLRTSTRILIPRSRYDETVTAIGELFGSITPGPTRSRAPRWGHSSISDSATRRGLCAVRPR